MSDIIDINVGETIEEVTINVTDNLITVNINKVTGGGGDVASVNGETGIVVLNQDDILDGTTYKQYSLTEKNKLAGIASGAEVNVNADWNAVSGDAEILNKPTIPDATSDLTNDSGFITIGDVPTPTFQEVTDEGNETTDEIIINNWKSKNYDNILGVYEELSTNKTATLKTQEGITNLSEWVIKPYSGVFAFESDIPDTSTFVPYTGATTNVDLGTHKLLAKDLDINHTSGSGDAATITKGGNGEALKVVKTSGSGNAASITGGVTLLDELHLTTDLADAYIASAPTWNAKQNALSYTPYKNIQTSQTVHTGTTAETLMLTATIPAGAFNSNDIMKVLYGANKTTNLSTFVLRLRINTTNTISGAPTIATYNGSASNQSDVVMRNYHLFGGNLLAHSFVTSTISDIFASPGLGSTPLNPANQFYIFFTITLNNASDNIIANMLSIHN
jgi:hypothetical protein